MRVWVDSIGASVEKSRNLEIERPRGADKSGVWVDSIGAPVEKSRNREIERPRGADKSRVSREALSRRTSTQCSISIRGKSRIEFGCFENHDPFFCSRHFCKSSFPKSILNSEIAGFEIAIYRVLNFGHRRFRISFLEKRFSNSGFR